LRDEGFGGWVGCTGKEESGGVFSSSPSEEVSVFWWKRSARPRNLVGGMEVKTAGRPCRESDEDVERRETATEHAGEQQKTTVQTTRSRKVMSHACHMGDCTRFVRERVKLKTFYLSPNPIHSAEKVVGNKEHYRSLEAHFLY
jgi:hypothetical protein